jgi:hypothetical protein
MEFSILGPDKFLLRSTKLVRVQAVIFLIPRTAIVLIESSRVLFRIMVFPITYLISYVIETL